MIAFIIILSVELIRNWYIIVRLRQSPNHAKGVVLRLMAFFFVALITYDAEPVQMWTYIIFCFLSFWFPFDVGLNLLRGKAWNYQGQTSLIDRLTYRFADIVWIVKFALMVYGFYSLYMIRTN
ncbi:MAG: hypothetical protein ACK47E_09335 [Cyclobacteriaceae bacterium]